MTLLDAALGLAARGVPVFPCGPDKAPRVAGGFHSASADPATIRGWTWDAMIGAAIPDGQVVIDIDPRNGGDETMALFPALPTTRTVRTMSGGTHLYFQVPETVALRPSLGPGVDVKRAGKGYVIVPPSPGYSYVRGGEPSLPPAWLLEELAVDVRERKVGDFADQPKFFDFQKGTDYGLAGLERQLGRLVTAEVGGRNDALNRAAFSLAQLAAGGELDWDYACNRLGDVALTIGLDKDEIVKTIASGQAAGEQEPWQAPPLKSAATPEPFKPQGAPSEEAFWVDWTHDEPDFPYYVRPFLPRNAYVLVYGATEASKSMAWVGILCKASHLGVRTSVYSLENPPATDRQRVRRWAPDPANFRITNQLLDMNDNGQLEALIRREHDWGTNVILIDTYSHAFHSHSDDGNAKAIAFAQRVRYVMQEVGCSVIVIDHTGYGDHEEPRDASAKRQQVDVAILMKKQGEWRPGEPSRFSMDNKKASRFGNPFFRTGEIRDTPEKGLALGWIGDEPVWEAA